MRGEVSTILSLFPQWGCKDVYTSEQECMCLPCISEGDAPLPHVEVSTMAMQRYYGRLVLLGYRASVLFDLQSFTLLEVQAYASDEGGADKYGD